MRSKPHCSRESIFIQKDILTRLLIEGTKYCSLGQWTPAMFEVWVQYRRICRILLLFGPEHGHIQARFGNASLVEDLSIPFI
jgi:hypothetical protein